MEESSHNPLGQPLVVGSDSVCIPEFGHTTCPSTLDLKLHHGEGSDVGSFASSMFGHLDAIDSIVSHDIASRVPEQTRVTTFDDDDGVYGGLSRDPLLGFDKLSQDLYYVHPHKASYNGLANRLWDILFTGDEAVDAISGFTEAGIDTDPPAIKLEQSVGPSRHYDHFRATVDETHGPGQVGSGGTQPNGDLISKSELLQDPTAGSHCQVSNTFLHCRSSAPASGPFIAPLGNLMAAIGIFLADMHEAGPAAINMLIGALDEEELATLGTLLAAMDEEEPVADFSTSAGKSSPMGAYWKASPSSSSATRQTRMNEYPKGVIHRFMPLGGIFYFGMDVDSFTRADIDPGIMAWIKDGAIEAADDFRQQNLGIAFAYDPSRMVFSIRYDPGLDRSILAEAFFPSDSPGRWHVRVSSLADDREVFEDTRKSMRNAFNHEFAHILGFRHYDAGSNPQELQEPSMLWPGTEDGGWNTIMRTGVHSRELRLFEEDFRVIREFYSKRNGAVVGGVRIVDVDPDERLRDFLQSHVRLLDSLIRSRRRQAQN